MIHPLLNQKQIISNNIALEFFSQRILLITGPNMGGKSTLLRTLALCVIMA